MSKLKDRIRNTIIGQITKVSDIVKYATNSKWQWAGPIARMKDNRWTVRSTEWQIKGVRSVGRPKRHWRDRNGMDKNKKGQKNVEVVG